MKNIEDLCGNRMVRLAFAFCVSCSIWILAIVLALLA